MRLREGLNAMKEVFNVRSASLDLNQLFKGVIYGEEA